jgi:hypothetical protein
MSRVVILSQLCLQHVIALEPQCRENSQRDGFPRPGSTRAHPARDNAFQFGGYAGSRRPARRL